MINKEYHPFIKETTSLIKHQKIILGSFPTWSISEPFTSEKEEKRIKSGDVLFFYGSARNKFWGWYQKYIDPNIVLKNINSIERSLEKQEIGISDTILSCKRRNKSASDTDLTCREYNYAFFNLPKKGETLKILCTSKGVMNSMLLTSEFFHIYPELQLNTDKSNVFQADFIKNMGGDNSSIQKPFYQELNVKQGGTIACLALPSPGSPFRGLKHFGFDSGDAVNYLDRYLQNSFQWFLE